MLSSLFSELSALLMTALTRAVLVVFTENLEKMPRK